MDTHTRAQEGVMPDHDRPREDWDDDDTLSTSARVVDWDEEPTVQCVYERDPVTQRWRSRSWPPPGAE